MNKTAFLFPGQGSQSIGMMSGLREPFEEVRDTFRTASEVLGYDLWDICQNGPQERLNQTEVTQPAMLAADIATWRAWKSIGGIDPGYVAGHSLGEYSALVASGSLEFRDAVALVAERGRLMQATTAAGAGAMAAVLGLEDDELSRICLEAEQGQVVSCANFNSPGQIVIAGDKAAVDRACELATGAGARRAILLAVSVPAHCALMRPAAEKLADDLESVPLSPGKIPLVHNVDAQFHAESGEIRDALVRQVWQPVRWAASVRYLISEGVARFAECGPGKVLFGLNRRISRDVSTVALVSGESLAAALEKFNQ